MEKAKDEKTLPPGVATESTNFESSSATMVLPAQQGELATDVATSVFTEDESFKQVHGIENDIKAYTKVEVHDQTDDIATRQNAGSGASDCGK